MESGDVSLMVPIRDGCVRKFKSFGNLGGLKTPRWSGKERIHPMSKTWHDSFTGSEVSGELCFQLLKIYMGWGGEFKGAEKVSLDCHRGAEGR